MNLTRCQNGHFYDMDKYSTCPHCLQNNAGQSDKTESVYAIKTGLQYGDGGDVTAPVNEVKSSKIPSGGGGDETEALGPQVIPADGGMQQYNREIDPKRIPMDGPGLFMRGPGPFMDGPGPSKKIDMQSDLQNKITYVSQTVVPEDMEEKTISFTVKSTKPVVGWLVCIKGTSMGKSYNLYSGKNFIGRSLSMDVVIEGDKSVSRDRHAVLVYDPKSKKFLVEPGMSRELFYLDDELVLTPKLIEGYQVITVGNTELMFVPFCGEKFDWKDHLEEKEE